MFLLKGFTLCRSINCDEFLQYLLQLLKLSSYLVQSNISVHDFWLHHKVDENCTLLGYYTASNSLPTFWDNLPFPSWNW